MFYKYVIIGGGVAGVAAAETIRKIDVSGSILIIGSEVHRLYSRVLLPHLAQKKIPEDKIWLRQEMGYKDNNIKTLFGHRVEAIKTVEATLVLTGQIQITYNKLLIATGGQPHQPNFTHDQEVNFLNLQIFEDALALKDSPAKSMAVVGGGFIALELLMAGSAKGMELCSVVRGNGFFGRVLSEISYKQIHQTLIQRGVKLFLQSQIENVTSQIDGQEIIFGSERIKVDTIGLGLGLDFSNGFLEDSKLKFNRGVVVDQFLETNIKNIFAAGDVAEYFDSKLGEYRRVGNWANALLQGKIAGSNMTGARNIYDAVTAYSINCFGLPITFLGATDLTPDSKKIQTEANGSIVELFIKNNRVVGASCVGQFTNRTEILNLITHG